MSGDMRTRLVVLPDLDQELTAAFGEVEELLLTLQWQETEDPDSSVAHPRALAGVHLFGALAEFERQLIRDRTLAGLAAARARGRVGGRPRSMTAAKLRVAVAMRAQDPPVSFGVIADELGVSKTTVARNLAAAAAAAAGPAGSSVAAGGVAR